MRIMSVSFNNYPVMSRKQANVQTSEQTNQSSCCKADCNCPKPSFGNLAGILRKLSFTPEEADNLANSMDKTISEMKKNLNNNEAAEIDTQYREMLWKMSRKDDDLYNFESSQYSTI